MTRSRLRARAPAGRLDTSGRSKDRGDGRPAIQHREGVGDREVGHRGAGFGGRAGEVRDEQHVLERHQARMNLGLVFVDVERRAGNQPFFERPGQRGFVHDRPARGIDQVRSALHFRQRLLIDEVFRLRRHRTVQRDHVRCREEAIEGICAAFGMSASRRAV
jgi:hypothetical protein